MGIKMATSFQDRSAYSLTHAKQVAARNALIAYLVVYGRLPCPASGAAATGEEDPAIPDPGGTCDTPIGILPYQTLQLPQGYALDGWDRFFTYEVWQADAPGNCVTAPLSVTNNANFTIPYRFLGVATNPLTRHDGDDGCITIQEDNDLDVGTTVLTRNVVAVIVSHGANGFGGFTTKGNQVDDAAVGVASPEKDNIAGHGSRTLRTFHTEPFNPNFDDLVLEISNTDLVNPLKRDGTIVSINQLARDQLWGNRTALVTSIAAGVCDLITLPAYQTATQPNGSPVVPLGSYTGLKITFANTATAPHFESSITISASDYQDFDGADCTTIKAP